MKKILLGEPIVETSMKMLRRRVEILMSPNPSGQFFGKLLEDTYDLYVNPEDLNLSALVLTKDSYEMLKTSDFLSLHDPLATETLRLIGRRELILMRLTAFFNNRKNPIRRRRSHGQKAYLCNGRDVLP